MTEQEALHFSGLILKYLRRELPLWEEQDFLKSVASDPEKQKLLDHYKDAKASEEALSYMQRLDTKEAWKKISGRINPGDQKKQDLTWWKWLSIAAMLAVAVTFGLFFYTAKTRGQLPTIHTALKTMYYPEKTRHC